MVFHKSEKISCREIYVEWKKVHLLIIVRPPLELNLMNFPL